MKMEIDSIAKIIIATIGLVSILIKFFDSISQNNQKKKLKSDLELLEKINTDQLIDKEDKIKVNEQFKQMLNKYLDLKDIRVKWFNVFYAIGLFIGFGWWTIYLYWENDGFNPWTILTGMISFIGISLLLDNEWHKRKNEKEIFKIIILEDFKIAVVIIGVAILLGCSLIFKVNGYSHWHILLALLSLFGFKMLGDGIKIKKR
jgi:hypothetical protein